ncbi:nicotinate-nicotinamide nucleotide adenylyltransferase [Thaumasiovibrio sp. DFM-14]|uniref:nicotinate-nicotinamide nucleotide adenylyltransferase n=1 Tax=Thaumasiovibrio sp. DFM-14 TaxID=3384792 RepID=UPI0039A08506
MKNIAIFGSAFNPPTRGHLSVVQRLNHYDEVWLIPSYAHAWGKGMLAFDIRCRLVERFIADSHLPNLKLVSIEQQLAENVSPVTTHAVLTALSLAHADTQFTFVIGPDNFLNFSKFYRFEDILNQWQVLSCPQTLDIRSTYVREAISENKSFAHLVTSGVASLLIEEGLYLDIT